MSVLKQKILDRTVTLGVVGLGYVGLPLAVEKAKAGFHVIGFDVQPQKVDMVNQGHNYIGDVVDSDLKKIVEEGMLRATTDFASVASCDCVCIAVPTPLDAHQQPDISYVRSSAESIMPHMHRDMLVVLESTTYPGTTEEMLRPILEKSGLKCGVDFFLAFSPERVDPGNAIYKTKNTPKVVGGVTPECTDIAATLYEAVLEAPVHRVSSPAVAEMEKILAERLKAANVPAMVVTMGGDGAVYAEADGESGFCPAQKVQVKDTTGAGDAFCAGVSAGLTYGKTIGKAVEIGTRLAASVITSSENVCPRFRPEEFGIEA